MESKLIPGKKVEEITLKDAIIEYGKGYLKGSLVYGTIGLLCTIGAVVYEKRAAQKQRAVETTEEV